jgi:hypothetical protein
MAHNKDRPLLKPPVAPRPQSKTAATVRGVNPRLKLLTRPAPALPRPTNPNHRTAHRSINVRPRHTPAAGAKVSDHWHKHARRT